MGSGREKKQGWMPRKEPDLEKQRRNSALNFTKITGSSLKGKGTQRRGNC